MLVPMVFFFSWPSLYRTRASETSDFSDGLNKCDFAERELRKRARSEMIGDLKDRKYQNVKNIRDNRFA